MHGGIGYSRHKPFEHIHRHHRRYRTTEGSDEIQLRRVAEGSDEIQFRRVAGIMFGKQAKR